MIEESVLLITKEIINRSKFRDIDYNAKNITSKMLYNFKVNESLKKNNQEV